MNVDWHPDPWPFTVTSQPIRLSTNCMTLMPSLTLTELQVVSMEHMWRVWHASRERNAIPIRTPGYARLPCFASYLDLLLSIGRDGQLHTSIYDKRDNFNFHITNFPFLSSNIPSSPAYGVFISQLIRYSRACSSYGCFILRARRLSSKLLKQGYLAERLKSSFRKFYGRYGDLIQQYEVSLSRMLNDILILDQQWLPNQSDFPPISWPWYRAWPSPIMSGFHGAFATGVACQQGTLTLPDTWFRPPFWDLLMLQLLRPNSSNLPCLYLTFHLEYPLVLSRFCLGPACAPIFETSFPELAVSFLEYST